MAGEYSEQVRLKSGVTLRSRVPREADSARRAPEQPARRSSPKNVKDARFSGFPHRWATPRLPLSTGILLVQSEVEMDDVEVRRRRRRHRDSRRASPYRCAPMPSTIAWPKAC